MTALHLMNALAWACNAVVWAVYAQSWPMASVSLIATFAACWMARKSRDYYF